MSALFFRYVRFVRRARILCLLTLVVGLWYDRNDASIVGQPFNLVKQAEHARAYENQMLRADHAHDLTAPAGAQ